MMSSAARQGANPNPARLRAEVASGPFIVPGCHDPLSARLAAEAGARAVFVSGGAVGRALFDEPMIPREKAETYLRYVRHICDSSPIPVIVDGEDGFGDPIALCAELTQAGAAAVIIGDSRRDGSLLPAAAFAGLIAEIRATFDLMLVPRADGIKRDRVDTCHRLHCYRNAGAEVVLPLLNSVLRSENGGELLATLTELAAASDGTLAVHSRLGHEMPPLNLLPAGIKLALVTAVSVPPSTDHLARVLLER